MKKILWLAVFLALFILTPRSISADGATGAYSWGGAMPVTINVNSATSVHFTVTFPTGNSTYSPIVCIATAPKASCGGGSDDSTVVYDTSTPDSSNPNKAIPEVYKQAVTWSYTDTNLTANTNYDLIIIGSAGYQTPTSYAFYTGSETVPGSIAVTAKPNGSSVIMSTTVDTTQFPYYQEFTASLVYSTDPALSNPIGGGPIPPTGNSGTAGTYTWILPSLTPNTEYYYQVTITDGTASVKSLPIGNFSTDAGAVLSSFNPTGGSSPILNSHIYYFLAPFPGFSQLPDPSVCAQEQASAAAAGQPAPICSINDLLNYALKLLIGISAVVLVFRLMYEGYTYMVTDVPFLKASSKSGFFTALMGLMLAMSAYIILNTINPKLVNGTINATQLSIGIDGDSSAPTVVVSQGQVPGGVYCPGSGKSAAISKIAQSFIGKVTYSYGAKNAGTQTSGYAQLDCSGWANTVLSCAGYQSPPDYVNSGSAAIFGGAEPVNMSTGFTVSGNSVSINNKVLNPGDLVGWPQVGKSYGHVILCR
jgi:hypothetical protein